MQLCGKLVKEIENEARAAGNKDLQVFTLSDRVYRMPFVKEGYTVIDGNMEYATGKGKNEKTLRLAYLEKKLE